MIDIEKNIAAVQARICRALAENSRSDDSVELLAVSKKQPISAILAANTAGLRDFGENYLQEAAVKISELQEKSLNWHFIGMIQSNKARSIADEFDWVHSVDQLKIAQRLSTHRSASRKPLNICLQVNIDDEDSKAGVRPDQLSDLIGQVDKLPQLCLRGLMAIPSRSNSAEQTRQSFSRMSQLFELGKDQLNSPHFDTLSMGMSNDLELAIAEGATLLRIGTDIFGSRPT